MAAIKKRQRSDGTHAYRVTWILGGGRGGAWQSETFDTERAANAFRRDVEIAGHQWPPGWVKGSGYVPAQADAEEAIRTPFMDLAERYLGTRHRVQGDTLARYRNQARALSEHFAWVEEMDDEAVSAWVRAMLDRGKSAKTIANYHGLLFSICAFGVKKELLTANPCTETVLPDRDDHNGEEIGCYLDRDELALLISCIHPDSRDVATVAVGTGLRWGELAALQPRELALTGANPTLNVVRAWKKIDGQWELGAPKTRRSRRTISLSPEVAAVLQRLSSGKSRDNFVFTAPRGGPLRHGTFYEERWQPAVADAIDRGLQKRPRFHDLRHTHASWLIAANVPLPVIQRRLGHESIQTTVDTYGHLVAESHEAVDAAISAALAPTLSLPEASAIPSSRRPSAVVVPMEPLR